MSWLVVLGLIGAGLWLALSGRPAEILLGEAVVTPLGETSVAVVGLENKGAPDRLIGVTSPVAAASLYSPVAESGVPVPVGTSGLALDGAHIRLDGQFDDGTLIPLTLRFENAGDLTLQARLSDPASTGSAQEVGLFGLGDICKVGEGEPAPAISLDITPDEDGWRVTVVSQEFTFREDLAGLYHVPGTGHGHLYVGGMKLGRLYAPEARIGALPSGRHEVRVTLNTNDHRAYVVGDDPVTASAVIVVD